MNIESEHPTRAPGLESTFFRAYRRSSAPSCVRGGGPGGERPGIVGGGARRGGEDGAAPIVPYRSPHLPYSYFPWSYLP